jgi:DNA invertase Pin-like site-specific DNA recombinase
MAKASLTRAFGYLRVSGRDQIKGDGFPRQLAAIKAYAAAHSIKLVRVFEEQGVSGKHELADRPALLDMLEALAADSVKLVLIEKLDRLARDLMVQETIIADLRKRGFELISVMEPDLCSTDPSRVLMRQIFGAIAEYDRSMIVAKLRGARERMKAKTGRCEGQKPYGFYDGEAEVLGRMKSLRDAGIAYDRIAAMLNNEGVAPRTGARWWGRTINNILSAQTGA